MRAWVSPPQDRVSHMVEVAAIMAQAASTALPPCSKILAPAVAASGLPVTAIQCWPCSAGFWVRAGAPGEKARSTVARHRSGWRIDASMAVLDAGERRSIWQTYALRTRVARREMQMDSPLVSGLYVYPVKSMRGSALERARLAPTGFEWDRQWMVINAQGTFLSQRTHPKLARIVPEVTANALRLSAPGMTALEVPFAGGGERIAVRVWRDPCTGIEQGSAAHAWVSEVLGEPVRLVRVAPGMGRFA